MAEGRRMKPRYRHDFSHEERATIRERARYQDAKELAAKLAANVRDGGGLDHNGIAAILPELREVDGIISSLRARAADLGMAA